MNIQLAVGWSKTENVSGAALALALASVYRSVTLKQRRWGLRFCGAARFLVDHRVVNKWMTRLAGGSMQMRKLCSYSNASHTPASPAYEFDICLFMCMWEWLLVTFEPPCMCSPLLCLSINPQLVHNFALQRAEVLTNASDCEWSHRYPSKL